MRKPAEVRSDADLQAIQTSVAFKNISDAIEQYRRQFGLAFLALIAFSAIHVGLVVIANLYTLETRVQGGVLSSASSDAPVSRPVAVGTASAQQVTDLAFIMTNLNEAEQKSTLARLESVDFVDAAGDYRQYTVTGFQLGGWKRSELKLYTSVGHVLSFVRGKGLRVFSEIGESSCNCTAKPKPVESRRQLLQASAPPATYDIIISDEIAANDECVYNVISQFSQFNYIMEGGVAVAASQLGDEINGRKLLQISASVSSISGEDVITQLLNSQTANVYGADIGSYDASGNMVKSSSFTEEGVNLGGLGQLLEKGNYWVEDSSTSLTADDWVAVLEAENYLEAMAQCLDNPTNLSPTEYTLYYLRKELAEMNESMLTYGTDWCSTNMWGGMKTCSILNGEETSVAQIGTFADSACLAEAELVNKPTCLFCAERFERDQTKKITAAQDLLNFINTDLPSAASLDQFATDVQNILIDKYGTNIVTELEELELAADTETDIGFGFQHLWENPPEDLAHVQGEIRTMTNIIRNFIVAEADARQIDCERTNAEFMNKYSKMKLEGLISAAERESVNPSTPARQEVDNKLEHVTALGVEAAKIAETASDQVSNCESKASARVYEDNREWFSQHFNNGSAVPRCLNYTITSDQVNLQDGETTFQHIMATRTFLTERCSKDWTCDSAKIETYFYDTLTAELQAMKTAANNANKAEKVWRDEFDNLVKFNMSFGDVWMVGDAQVIDSSPKSREEAIGQLITSVSATLSEKVTTLTNEWNDFKEDLVWTAFKEAPVSQGIDAVGNSRSSGSSLGTWGCSSLTNAEIDESLSPINVYAYDACHVEEWMTIRKPFVTGVIFSEMMGGFDSYSLFLSQTFCSQLEGKAGSGERFWEVEYTDISFLNDYVLMLHGWGGSYDFLHLSAAVLFYGTFGVGSGYGPRTYYPCNNKDDMENYDEWSTRKLLGDASYSPTACISRGAPGGMMVMSPDGGQCPLPQKNLWINSEFSGHILDFVVFEFPAFLLGNLGMNGRAFGLFGCSMGGFGSFQAAMKYPHVVNAIGGFNSPIYPQECHFGYTCHHVCATNMILCELVFTSGNQAMNAYVILFAGSLVVSTSSTDPISWGEAVHMANNGGYVECKYTSSADLVGSTGVLVSEFKKGSKFLTISDEIEFGSSRGGLDGKTVCQYQDWDEKEHYSEINENWCTELFQNVVSVDPGMMSTVLTFGGKGETSGRWTFDTSLNYEGANPHFDCNTNSCHSDFTNDMMPYLPCYHKEGIKEGSEGLGCTTGSNQLCSQFHCADTKWCVEANLATTIDDRYLNGVAVTASIMKFVTPYHPTDNMPIVSAWGRQLFTMPSMLIKHKIDLWMDFTLIIFLHCSQNDEFLLFPMFIDLTSMLQYASEFEVSFEEDGTYQVSYAKHTPAFNSKSRFVVDFGDCDYHHFSERDMKMGNLFFADALRGYTQDFMGMGIFTTRNHADFRMCWMPAYGFNSVYATTGVLDACILQWYGTDIGSFYDANGEFANVYSLESWGISASHNTVHQDTDAVKDMEKEAMTRVDAHGNPCQESIGTWLVEGFVASGGKAYSAWFNQVNPAHKPGTTGTDEEEYVCGEDFFVYEDADFDDMMGDGYKPTGPESDS